MSVQYVAVGWNRQKRVYDSVLLAGAIGFLLIFLALGSWLHPDATAETHLIRGFGALAFLLLNVILIIGPLCRLDRRFLPFLYNRRHLGVSMFVFALAHGVFSIIQFHALGDINPLVSVLVSNVRFDSISQFPFQQLGLAALTILFLMAATSHDFWLHALTPPVWKRLHMLVYIAYFLIVAHVLLGVLQSETSPVLAALVCLSILSVSTVHIAAGLKERPQVTEASATEGYVRVCEVDAIPDRRSRIVTLDGERVAVFRNFNKVSAISNVCRHQNGPLGEGKIVNGCVTCPWHGYQYDPATGASPPPFTDKVPTFQTKIIDGVVWVHPRPYAAGAPAEPSVTNMLSSLAESAK